MTDNIENLILEYLKNLRNDLRDFKTESLEELKMIKHRMTSLEGQTASIHADMALIHTRIDRVDIKMERIERRLELNENP